MKLAVLLAPAVAAALIVPGVASAAIETLEFSGAGQYGPISGQMVLDVVGGLAISGTGSISGAGISGTETLTLITPSTPGSSGYSPGIGWRSGGGTDTWGWDNVVPIDYVGGLDFSFGAGTSPPQWGYGGQFGIWNNDGVGGPGGGYQAWMSGSGFYGTTEALTVSYFSNSVLGVSGIPDGTPEPSTWTMMALGFAGLGFAGYRARQSAISSA